MSGKVDELCAFHEGEGQEIPATFRFIFEGHGPDGDGVAIPLCDGCLESLCEFLIRR